MGKNQVMLQSYSLINTVSKISGISEWVFIQLAPPELYVIKYGLVRNSQNDFLSQYRIDYLSTLKPRYSEPRFSEFSDIVNKIQLPF